jgi:rfaE bifunctional protein kinase chain/domain
LKRFERLIRSFSGKKVVIVGDMVADEFVYGRTNRLSREAPVPIVMYEYSRILLGGAANVVNNVLAMGGNAVPVGVVGYDDSGRQVAALFNQAGADSSFLVRDRTRPTVTKTRILAGDMSTVTQQMLRLDRGNHGDLHGKLRKGVLDAFEAAVRGADCVIFSDYGEGVLCDHVRDEMLTHVRKKGLVVTADSRFKIHAYSRVHAVTPNLPEISQFAKRRIETEVDIAAAAASLQRKTGCRGVLVKRGSKGMAVYRRNRDMVVIPPYGSMEVADVTGAGDTVIAAFSLSLCCGADMADAARVANLAGGIKVTKRGTATVSSSELLRSIDVLVHGPEGRRQAV